jgi:erythromycin esterase-like protein
MALYFDQYFFAVEAAQLGQRSARIAQCHDRNGRTAWARHCILLVMIFLGMLCNHCASLAQTPVESAVSFVPDRDEDAALKAVLKETCNRQIVLVGENGFHGEGKTMAFKARLIEELVTDCGFRIVLFESSQFEFLDIERKARRGDSISRAQISAAIGQIWNQNLEIDHLISFLVSKKNKGRFIVGGLDDQLGSRGLLFGNDPMIAELTGLLNRELQQSCKDRLLRRTYSAYSQEAPYSVEERDGLRACVGAIRQALLGQPQAKDGQFLLAMLDNLDRYLARDFQSDVQRISSRDASMHMNVRWWLANRGTVEPKVIIWAANSHIAKGRGIDPNYDGAAPLGNLIAADFGKRSYSVGFSANSGTYRWSRVETKIIPTDKDSLEGKATGTTGQSVVFMRGKDLGRKPEISGLLNHQFYRAEWRKFFDGVIVFQSERPPNRSNN